MYNLLTWKDENGVVTTRATKAKLTERLFVLESFLQQLTAYEISKYRLGQTARFLKHPVGTADESYFTFFRNLLSKEIAQHKAVRDRIRRMYARLTKETMVQPGDFERETMPVRPINQEHARRLMKVLEDNGIEADECETVAEAICFVLDLDASLFQQQEVRT